MFTSTLRRHIRRRNEKLNWLEYGDVGMAYATDERQQYIHARCSIIVVFIGHEHMRHGHYIK